MVIGKKRSLKSTKMKMFLAGLVEQIQSNTADSNKPKTKLAVHQMFGSDLIAMKVFEPSETGITIGSELATRFRFVGTPVAWVPEHLVPLLG